MAASCCLPDIWSWIKSLPPTNQWKSDSQSIIICSSTKQLSLKFYIKKNPNSDPYVTFSLIADFHFPISLWSSSPCKLDPQTNAISKETLLYLFLSFFKQVLLYGPKRNSYPITPQYFNPSHEEKFPQFFNLAFASLLLCVCVYEAPTEIRSPCIQTIQNHIINSEDTKESLKKLLLYMGANLEEQWIRSIHLALTNAMDTELAHTPWTSHDPIRRVLSLGETNKTCLPFSYSLSSSGLWKIQFYSAMVMTKAVSSSEKSIDDRLLFSLKHQHIEAVVQLSYRVHYKRDNWIEIMVGIDNIRCDIVPLVSEKLMSERGLGIDEKHFPSRICLRLSPVCQSQIISVSVSKSSANPAVERGAEKNIEGGFDAPGTYFGLKVSSGDSMSISLRPWKFEQTADGTVGHLSWVLYEVGDGKEIYSAKHSKISMLNPKAWFKDRYSSACRAFTRQGGVIFAGDEYGEGIAWKVRREALGSVMKWEMKGCIWVTYLPNKHNTFYGETRCVEFNEILELPLYREVPVF